MGLPMFWLVGLTLGTLVGGVNGQFQFQCGYYAIGALKGTDISNSGTSDLSNCNAATTKLNAELGSQFHCVLSAGRYGGGHLFSYNCDNDVQELEAELLGLDFSCFGGVGQVRLSASGAREDCTAKVGQLNTYIAAAPLPSPSTTQQQAGLMVTSRHGAAACALVSVPGYPTSHCVTTGDGDYGAEEACTVLVLNAGTLSATGTFATERSVDFLSIGVRHFSGTSGPSDVAVAAGSSFYWSTITGSNPLDTGAGWTICLTLAASQPPTGAGESLSPTPAPTTVAPTTAPIANPTMYIGVYAVYGTGYCTPRDYHGRGHTLGDCKARCDARSDCQFIIFVPSTGYCSTVPNSCSSLSANSGATIYRFVGPGSTEAASTAEDSTADATTEATTTEAASTADATTEAETSEAASTAEDSAADATTEAATTEAASTAEDRSAAPNVSPTVTANKRVQLTFAGIAFASMLPAEKTAAETDVKAVFMAANNLVEADIAWVLAYASAGRRRAAGDLVVDIGVNPSTQAAASSNLTAEITSPPFTVNGVPSTPGAPVIVVVTSATTAAPTGYPDDPSGSSAADDGGGLVAGLVLVFMFFGAVGAVFLLRSKNRQATKAGGPAKFPEIAVFTARFDRSPPKKNTPKKSASYRMGADSPEMPDAKTAAMKGGLVFSSMHSPAPTIRRSPPRSPPALQAQAQHPPQQGGAYPPQGGAQPPLPWQPRPQQQYPGRHQPETPPSWQEPAPSASPTSLAARASAVLPDMVPGENVEQEAEEYKALPLTQNQQDFMSALASYDGDGGEAAADGTLEQQIAAKEAEFGSAHKLKNRELSQRLLVELKSLEDQAAAGVISVPASPAAAWTAGVSRLKPGHPHGSLVFRVHTHV